MPSDRVIDIDAMQRSVSAKTICCAECAERVDNIFMLYEKRIRELRQRLEAAYDLDISISDNSTIKHQQATIDRQKTSIEVLEQQKNALARALDGVMSNIRDIDAAACDTKVRGRFTQMSTSQRSN